MTRRSKRPNILFVMTDQQRFDTIASLGNAHIRTPNLDRLVARGLAYTNAYSSCPVCIPARYTIGSGCEPIHTGVYANAGPPDMHSQIEGRCGPWLAATMGKLGYRSFGVGKFHTVPFDAPVGFDVQLRSEETYDSQAQRNGDAYAAWITKQHPEYDWIEALMGERTEMYYMPQMSPLPAALTVESWAADRVVEQMRVADDRPFFGFVSFIGPHPPFAPPLPFNRMYDPDAMPNSVSGERAVDHLDQIIPWMNYAIWAEDVNDSHARVLRARYYGEISYIDHCLGRILDAIDERDDAEATLVCFFADHGDHLGDHGAWQKESFFEPSTRVPFLLSWPASLPAGEVVDDLVALTDLFGLATAAAGEPETRDGVDLLAVHAGDLPRRDRLFGYYGRPGRETFKLMVREDHWKLVWMANGGVRLLFDLASDPHELCPRQDDSAAVADRLQSRALDALVEAGVTDALGGDGLRTFGYRQWPQRRIYQFDESRGVRGFPSDPSDLLAELRRD